MSADVDFSITCSWRKEIEDRAWLEEKRLKWKGVS
jgi:hypothetical protein